MAGLDPVASGAGDGSDGSGHGGRPREPGCLLFGPDLSDRICAEAADPGRGGVLPARPPRQPDPVSGGVRKDRHQIPGRDAPVGARQQHSNDPVQGRRPESRRHGALPGRRPLRRAFRGGGGRLCTGVRPGVDRDETRHRSRRVPPVLLHQATTAGVGVLRLHLGHPGRPRVHQDLHLLPLPDQGLAQRSRTSQTAGTRGRDRLHRTVQRIRRHQRPGQAAGRLRQLHRRHRDGVVRTLDVPAAAAADPGRP
jgi:hypothetical protein